MGNRKILALASLLLLGGCGAAPWPELGAELGPARATSDREQSAQAPAWRVGSEWRYSDGYGLKVTQVDGPLTTFQRLDDPSQWVIRRGFLREDARSGTTLRKLLFEDLPPGAGKSLSSSKPLTYRREFLSGGVERTHVTSWMIEGRETVKVSAGEFDCLVLVMRTRNLDDGWTGFERWWFSPAAQNYVRMEYRYGPAVTGSRVLSSYRLNAG